MVQAFAQLHSTTYDFCFYVTPLQHCDDHIDIGYEYENTLFRRNINSEIFIKINKKKTRNKKLLYIIICVTSHVVGGCKKIPLDCSWLHINVIKWIKYDTQHMPETKRKYIYLSFWKTKKVCAWNSITKKENSVRGINETILWTEYIQSIYSCWKIFKIFQAFHCWTWQNVEISFTAEIILWHKTFISSRTNLYWFLSLLSFDYVL